MGSLVGAPVLPASLGMGLMPMPSTFGQRPTPLHVSEAHRWELYSNTDGSVTLCGAVHEEFTVPAAGIQELIEALSLLTSGY